MSTDVRTLLQELDIRTVEMAVATDIRGTKSMVARGTIKAVAQDAENSREPCFDGLKAIGNLALSAGISDEHDYLTLTDFENLGRLIS